MLQACASPSLTYRWLVDRRRTVNIEDTRKELVQLRTGLQSISKELNDNFADLDHLPADDGFAKVMWRFVREAGENLSSLVDRISLATSSFASVLSYFGEDHRPYTSSEFFGIFQEFIASYKVSRAVLASAMSLMLIRCTASQI